MISDDRVPSSLRMDQESWRMALMRCPVQERPSALHALHLHAQLATTCWAAGEHLPARAQLAWQGPIPSHQARLRECAPSSSNAAAAALEAASASPDHNIFSTLLIRFRTAFCAVVLCLWSIDAIKVVIATKI